MQINKKLFPGRKKETHKGDYGKVFILAGCDGMLGAAILASRACLRSGAGVVYLGIPARSKDAVNIATPEVIVVGGESANDFSDVILKADVFAFGPGLGERRKISRELMYKLSALKITKPILLDADGIAAFNNDIGSLKNLSLNLILTPHPGELSKLLSKSVDEIIENKEKYASETAKYLNIVVVLKGNKTVVADKSGHVFINRTGNPGMATAGSGDVLSGMIAGFIGQKMAAFEAACAGVYIHGLAGDFAAVKSGEYGMIASDIISNIPDAIKKVQKE